MIDFLQNNIVLTIFLIGALGYLLGSIQVKGISLGTAGILIVALLFGHFGIVTPAFVQNLGLICFVTSVGFIAGPKFFQNFKGNAIGYVFVGIVIIVVGVLTCIAVVKFSGIGVDLGLGLMSGALTSTPGLAAGIEVTGSNLVLVGYGIAYPFGVVSVVLFVQLIPILLKVNLNEERIKYSAANNSVKTILKMNLFSCDPKGFFGFALAIIVGVLIGKITIPLPGSASFSLGISGGPLLAGLLFGHFGRIGKLNISVENDVLVTLREFGLSLFLIGAGTNAGEGFLEVLAEQGPILFIYGAIIALVPMIVGYLVASRIFKFSLFNSLGSVCGGMTSTPALGILIQVAQTEDVASAYAATYPVALATVVLLTQLVGEYLV